MQAPLLLSYSIAGARGRAAERHPWHRGAPVRDQLPSFPWQQCQENQLGKTQRVISKSPLPGTIKMLLLYSYFLHIFILSSSTLLGDNFQIPQDQPRHGEAKGWVDKD